MICHSLKNIPTFFEIFGKNPRVSVGQISLEKDNPVYINTLSVYINTLSLSLLKGAIGCLVFFPSHLYRLGQGLRTSIFLRKVLHIWIFRLVCLGSTLSIFGEKLQPLGFLLGFLRNWWETCSSFSLIFIVLLTISSNRFPLKVIKCLFFSQEDPICSQILILGHLLVVINSSVNFLVYSLGDSKKIFR